MRVLLSVSGTYPFFPGGVSVWAHHLVTSLPAVEFRLVSIVSNPNVTRRFPVRDNVRLTTIPLWGVGRPEEFSNLPPSALFARFRRPSPRLLDREFLSPYRIVLAQCMHGGPNPGALGHALAALARFVQTYDFYTAMRHPTVWEAFTEALAGDPLFARLSALDAVTLCRRFERYLRVLTASRRARSRRPDPRSAHHPAPSTRSSRRDAGERRTPTGWADARTSTRPACSSRGRPRWILRAASDRSRYSRIPRRSQRSPRPPATRRGRHGIAGEPWLPAFGIQEDGLGPT